MIQIPTITIDVNVTVDMSESTRQFFTMLLSSTNEQVIPSRMNEETQAIVPAVEPTESAPVETAPTVEAPQPTKHEEADKAQAEKDRLVHGDTATSYPSPTAVREAMNKVRDHWFGTGWEERRAEDKTLDTAIRNMNKMFKKVARDMGQEDGKPTAIEPERRASFIDCIQYIVYHEEDGTVGISIDTTKPFEINTSELPFDQQ